MEDNRARIRGMDNTAIEEGIEKGRKEGLAEGHAKLIKTARNLKALDVSTDIIVKSTGLSLEEIAKL